ncbi:acetoacetate--CoA ligase [Hahella sp. SMD15-11]|uniref:Acetoacetate--CoA ligase n=1 Tax=Thermohahella caldifontis TaxID=3142973 RepID=A0AB39UXH8_9GAMM
MTTQPLWVPSEAQKKSAVISSYIRWLQDNLQVTCQDWSALHRWSVEHKEAFWHSLVTYFNVQGDFSQGPVLENPDAMPGARWFPNARLSFAENLLQGNDQALALIEHAENGERRTLTRAELRQQVGNLAHQLRELGVQAGDRVAAITANRIEAVIGMLATTSIGAVWSSCSPEFGLSGILDRFTQIEPRVLIAVNGYRYAGKIHDCRDKVLAVSRALPSLSAVIPYHYEGDSWDPSAFSCPVIGWEHAVAGQHKPAFERVPFNHPLYILYSSGTTGKPKCIVHGTGGTLLQHVKELGLHTNLRAGDRILFYTTCGWMMWNWLVSALALQAVPVLYDGSPFAPDARRLWEIAEQEELVALGAGAKFYAGCDKAGVSFRETPNALPHLRTLLSTGSPLAHETFDYLYQHIKPDVCVSSISGGTDIVSCFALGNPILPVYRGELQCIGLGMDVAFYDDAGQPVPPGTRGELVCRQPFPSMPVGFWNDPDQCKYRGAYFERFPGVWAHGDFGELSFHPASGELPEQTGVIIHGRSDATLNPGGVRIGTAEIYRQVETFDEVLEALVVGQRWQDDERIVLFVRLRDGVSLTEELQSRIRARIREQASVRHVPAKIIAVPDIPRTLSGKISELAVKRLIHGEAPGNTDALANPEALDHFRNLAELQS